MSETLARPRLLIAVVDNDDSVRRALSRLVRSLGMDVETFASGGAFLEELRHATPDCLVLDMNMPDLDGLQVQSQIARSGFKMPVILISGSSDPTQVKLNPATHDLRFLKKPFTDEELLSAIISVTKPLVADSSKH